MANVSTVEVVMFSLGWLEAFFFHHLRYISVADRIRQESTISTRMYQYFLKKLPACSRLSGVKGVVDLVGFICVADKKCLMGGFGDVFGVGSTFRFTDLDLYIAYWPIKYIQIYQYISIYLYE